MINEEKREHHATKKALQKLELAKTLLMRGAYISDVAAQIGYRSQSHLNHNFKEFTGQSIVDFLESLGIRYTKKKSSLKTKLEEKLELAKKHLDEGKTVIESARLAGFSSPNHLSNKFKKWYFMSPTQYLGARNPVKKISDQMIETARNHLIDGKAIAQAASLAGFSNTEQFSDVFKRRYRTTPTQYQQDNTNQRKDLETKVNNAIDHILAGQLINETVRLAGFKSTQQMTRAFKKIYHTNPVEYKNKLLEDRIDTVKKQLLEGKSVDTAAKLAGFKKGNFLHHVFIKHVGMSPSKYKDQRYVHMLDTALNHYLQGKNMSEAAKLAGFGGKDHFDERLKKQYGRSLKAHLAYLKEQEKLEEAKKYLVQGFTVAETAELLCFKNTRDFVTKFTKTNSISPTKYQHHIETGPYDADERLELAKEYLMMGKPPNIVAELSGFYSVSDFKKTFKSMYNCTPDEYIQQIREKNMARTEPRSVNSGNLM